MLVLVLVLDDSAIGDANGALDQGCLQAAVSLQQSIEVSLGAGAAHGLAKSEPRFWAARWPKYGPYVSQIGDK